MDHKHKIKELETKIAEDTQRFKELIQIIERLENIIFTLSSKLKDIYFARILNEEDEIDLTQ